MTYRDLAVQALQELNIVDPTDPPANADVAFTVEKIQRLVDEWNAQRLYVFADTFPEYTITPNLSPHTIGPTGATWTAVGRPVSIDGAQVILNVNSTAPFARSGLTLRNAAWWLAQSVPTMTAALPTDLYYDPTFPNGSVYLWPVPTVAYKVELLLRVLLDSAVGQSTTFTLPPGYWQAIVLSVAEDICGPFSVPIPKLLPGRAAKARAVIRSNNSDVPLTMTNDYGIPTAGSPGYSRPNFNWLNGQIIR